MGRRAGSRATVYLMEVVIFRRLCGRLGAVFRVQCHVRYWGGGLAVQCHAPSLGGREGMRGSQWDARIQTMCPPRLWYVKTVLMEM